MHSNLSGNVIRFSQLRQMLGISRSTIFRWERDGKFPKHFNLGRNSVAWLLGDVQQCLAERSGGTEHAE